ncbi:nucleotidyltransferase substrate binding protein [uncultured Thiodictyon sp.]|uniref:nucleotidyltransferase substrate binding protein n=1 Tax=uncultured Thiodictyon sp. TaxID=1846217 RepID=UPI0025FA53B7|nr:nucleotidyltransferase substrate binding protein [uncultured Thiodictyon sp.]
MTLVIEPFVRAIARLDEGLARYLRETSDLQIRDGLIQRFEFTYELSHKTLKRYLEETSASPAQYDGMSFADLIRSANEAGLLLSDWPAWRGFREMRNQTSHAYDEAVAQKVVAGIPAFLGEVIHLRDRLTERLTESGS